MQIEFSAARAADAPVVVFPVAKDGLDHAIFAGLDEGAIAIVRAAARAARFEGEAAALAEAIVPAGAAMAQAILVGVGAGSEGDYERAGGAITARLLTSGATDAVVDMSALAEAPVPAAVARLAAAIVARGWRLDRYRTKLPEKQKITLTRVTLVGAPDGAAAAWEAHWSWCG